jgi:two-component system sensor histidine kinase/response regulator
MDRAPSDLPQALAELALLRRAHELLVSTLNAASDGIVTLLYSDGSIYYNIRFAEMWDIPEDRLGGVSQTSLIELMLSRAKNPGAFAALIEQRRRNPEADDLSILELEDGRVLERRVTPQRSHGQCVGCVVTFRDITERVRYEEKMRFSSLVVENSGPMIWIHPAEDALIYGNKAACDALGYSSEEFVGMPLLRVVSDCSGKSADLVATELHDGGKPVASERLFRRKDGSFLDADVTAFVARDDQRALCIASFKDITGQKRAEQEKRRQQATLESLINSIPDRIFYKDVAGRYLGCNTAFAVGVGRPAAEVPGLSAHDLYPQEVADALDTRDKAVLSELREHSAEYWVTYPDGKRALYETVVSPLWDEQGEPQGVLGIGRNITHRKEQEEEVRRSKEIAEDATRMKSDFLANMSHEIRTPMNAIIGLSHLALRTDMTARQRDYIGKIQTSGQQLLRVVNDILDFSKVEAGKLDLEHNDFDLQRLLDNVANLIGEKSDAKGLELVFEVAPDVPLNLVGDSLRLGQILLNYASNAVKFTEKGEIIISVEASERTDKDVLVHFRVQDSGIGLAPEQASCLFRSFTQADTSITRKFGGTGLGLAIAKQLAELMGGEVGVQTEQGIGSTFWFSARLGIGAVNQRQLLPSLDLRGRRVLVVDDNEHARAVIVDMLQGMTFLTTEAASGPAAVEEVRKAADSGHPYDVVYLDWRMPGPDGIETARRIQALRLAAPPRLLLLTAHGGEEVLKEAEDAGIQQVLVKPVSASILFDCTMNVLGERLAEAAPASPPSAVADPRLATLRGARILLVEDNDINQLIARALLEDVGLVVDVADNGQVALGLAQQAAYDLVFMDMQMPVMDGVTATRELRKLPRLGHLPIVAMTANAMERDRRMCIDAGMNDFLVKPIDQQDLLDILLRWIGARRAAPAPAPAKLEAPPANIRPAAPTAGELPEGIAGLDTTLGLSRMLGKKSLYLAMLRRYLVGQERVAQDMRQALAAGDRATAERLAHTTKSVSANIGATLVQARAAALESAIEEGCSATDIARLVDELDAPLGVLLGALDGFLAPQAVPV